MRHNHLKKILPKNLRAIRAVKQAIVQFDEAHNFVYFGYVNQHNDEHQLVRGLTLSPHHHDEHYSVGTVDGYDIALLQRTDTIGFPGTVAERYVWLIMQFDLRNAKDIPHMFVGLHAHSPAFYAHFLTKFNTLQKVPLGTFGMYERAFTDKYAIYTTPTASLSAERLFDQEITKLISQHFGNLTFEVADESLYLYSSHQRITKPLLETMLENGLWLARHLDERAKIL